MVVVAQGDIFWADRRPVVVVQGDAFNRSAIATVVCVPLTSNLRWAEAPGNVRLPRRSTGLVKDSVANVSQIITIDRELLPVAWGESPAGSCTSSSAVSTSSSDGESPRSG